MTSLKDFDYEEIKVIGRGQYGKAHLVRYTKDTQLYICKTIDLTCLSKKERESALQEVELLRRLDHPNIVEYKRSFFMGDTLAIAMQYCEGGDIANYIKDLAKRRERFLEVHIMNYLVQILQALQYIHSERILHRDLKTSNLFLTKMKQLVKLGDFGISRVLEGSIEAALTVVGTPYYMSPEVCENKPYTFKSDVWSLGCVLYELCMLKHAFSADNLLGLVYKIVSDKYEPIPKMYSLNLNALIQRMLNKSADARPSVGDLLAESYVQSFMQDYVKTKGQCASESTAKTGQSRTSGTVRRPGALRRAAAEGSGGAGGAAGGAPGAGSTIGGGKAGGAGGGAVRPQRHHHASGAAGGGKRETPKEAVARRKRELADREGEKLKAAAKDATNNKTVARKMKEAEFQSTSRMPNAAPDSPLRQSSSFESSSITAAAGPLPEPNQAWPLQAAGTIAEDDGSISGSDVSSDGLEPPLEEISGADSSAEDFDSGEEYEEDFCSEEDDHPEEIPEAYHMDIGALSTVREEEDFTRVMSNYESDIGCGAPPQRRSNDLTIAAPSVTASLSASQVSPGGASGGAAGGAAGGLMDLRSRACRLQDELKRKMGPDTFNKVFDYIFESRTKNVDERVVRRELEKMVGRDTYRLYCFEVDQLVFQKMLYS